MNVYPIEAGNFKLDGGAMFGVVPKSLWTKTNPADADNMIEMSSRCMLVENNDKLILVDTGMGDKQSEKFFKYYKRWGSDNLVKSINSAGFSIDDVLQIEWTNLTQATSLNTPIYIKSNDIIGVNAIPDPK